MVKKVLIISTSLRGGSNSDILANECAKGAKEAGHDVELLSLKGKDIKYCIGCLSCQRTGMCVQKDDIADIMAKVKNAEVIVYATPIYYYEMCGQMKTLLDRLNPLYSADYLFRDIYMIATAAENDESAFEKAYNGLQGWVDCFEKASLKGMVGGGGINVANTAEEARLMAKVGRGQTRRDSKRRVLRPGESVRADGKYQYKHHIDGKPHFVYSWKLELTDKLPKGKKPCLSLRKLEKQVNTDLDLLVNIVDVSVFEGLV